MIRHSNLVVKRDFDRFGDTVFNRYCIVHCANGVPCAISKDLDLECVYGIIYNHYKILDRKTQVNFVII